MLNAKICKGEASVIEANGTITELMADVAVLVSGIYNQFLVASPDTAVMFRTGLINLAKDENGPMWQPVDGQKGIIFPRITEEE